MFSASGSYADAVCILMMLAKYVLKAIQEEICLRFSEPADCKNFPEKQWNHDFVTRLMIYLFTPHSNGSTYSGIVLSQVNFNDT